MEQGSAGGRGRGSLVLSVEGRDFLQCSKTKRTDGTLGRALFPSISFSTVSLLPQIQEATGPHLVIRSSSMRAFVSPSDIRLAGQGAYKSSLTLPALCYLRGKITFLCGEARCQESSEQDRGRQSCRLAAPVAWSRSGLPWGCSPSNGPGPVLMWRVCFSERGGGKSSTEGELGWKDESDQLSVFSGAKSSVWMAHSFSGFLTFSILLSLVVP